MKRVCITTAFQLEYNILKEYIFSGKYCESYTHGITYAYNNRVVLVMSGVGGVNSSRALQYILIHFQIKYIIDSGIAGGVRRDIPIGTVTIPERWISYDNLAFYKGELTFLNTPVVEPGWKVRFKGEKVARNILYDSYINKEGESIYTDEYPVDTHALEYSKSLCHPWLQVGGYGIAGSIFQSDPIFMEEYLLVIWPELRGANMETQAIAKIATIYKIPFISIRGISDVPPEYNLPEPEIDTVEVTRRVAQITKEVLSYIS